MGNVVFATAFSVLLLGWTVLIAGVAVVMLPLYVALEKIHPSVLEAAQDLYADGWSRFRRVTLPLALAELGLIDEYEFVVQPRLAGHGPTLFAGLSKPINLRLVDRLEFKSGAVAMRYEARR